MTLPIYHNHQAPNTRPAQCNAGLWFERFFDQFGHEWKVRDEKVDWLKNNFNRSTGNNEQLENHTTQQQQLVENLQGTTKVFKTQWHFITGMGNPHPVENGLSWHPTLGVPYLSGAAVKGIVRNWLEIWEPQAEEKAQKEKLLDWFGSTSKDPSEKDYEAITGKLIFFDAFPIEPVLMSIDIMTPHMGKWYEKGNEIKNSAKEPEKLPADWHDPVPIPYLAVKQARFLFSIAPRNANCNIEIDTVMQALENALNFIGAGAKTAVGYGQMQADERGSKHLKEAAKKQAQQAAMQSMTEQQQHIAELKIMLEKDQEQGNKQAGNPTNQKLLALIKQAQAENWEQADKNQLADLGEAIFDYIGWGKGKKKRQRKDMFIELRGD